LHQYDVIVAHFDDVWVEDVDRGSDFLDFIGQGDFPDFQLSLVPHCGSLLLRVEAARVGNLAAQGVFLLFAGFLVVALENKKLRGLFLDHQVAEVIFDGHVGFFEQHDAVGRGGADQTFRVLSVPDQAVHGFEGDVHVRGLNHGDVPMFLGLGHQVRQFAFEENHLAFAGCGRQGHGLLGLTQVHECFVGSAVFKVCVGQREVLILILPQVPHADHVFAGCRSQQAFARPDGD